MAQILAKLKPGSSIFWKGLVGSLQNECFGWPFRSPLCFELSVSCVPKRKRWAPEALAEDRDFSLAKLQLSSSLYRLLSSVWDGVKLDLILWLLTLPQKMNHIWVKWGFYFLFRNCLNLITKLPKAHHHSLPNFPQHKHAHAHMHTHNVCTHGHMRTHMHRHTHTMYARTDTHAHACTGTHMHTHTQAQAATLWKYLLINIPQI